MAEKTLSISRRKFIIVSSEAIALPLFLDLTGTLPEARGNLSGKIYFITSECVGCQTCRLFCPASAIRFADCRNEVMQDKCMHCGTCYRECPLGAISETIV
jgi:ferredoxin